MKKLILAVTALCMCYTSMCTTFTVTTNADSGPGSLREAITLCSSNGIAVRDSIIFAIPGTSQAARTITLLSALPLLSSNMVVNGASQSGSPIGVSDARVVVLLTINITNFKFFEIKDCNDVGIYGMAMVSTFINTYVLPVTGISYVRCHNLQIGRAGAGNYIFGCAFAINCNTSRYGNYIYGDTSRQLTIQSNIVGLDEAGGFSNTYQSVPVTPVYLPLFIISTANILIGGDNTIDGNTMIMGSPYAGYSVSGVSCNIESCRDAGNGYLIIKNNQLGTKKDGTWDPATGPLPFFINATFNYRTDYDFKFIHNVLQGQLNLQNLGNYFYIQGNTIFSPYINTIFDAAITLYNNYGGGIIGGDQPGEGNTIYNQYTQNIYYFTNYATWVAAIRFDLGSHTTIRNNITLCNKFAISSIQNIDAGSYYDTYAYVRIDSIGTNFAKGKATPNTRVDVYLDDDCFACEGKQFLGFIMANSDSSWQYTGTFTGTVVATSTSMVNGQTSPFSIPYIQDYYVKVKQPTCGKRNGTVTGLTVKGYTNVKWHLLRQVAGVWTDSLYATTINLDSAGPGTYIFDAWLGNSCRSVFRKYELGDMTPKLDTSQISIQNPGCGLNNGSIKNITLNTYQDLKIKWIDASGAIVGTQPDLVNVGTGQYKLIILDTISGCSDSTRFYDLVNQTGPSFNTGNILIRAAYCNSNNGSISGITAINVTGTPFYQWVDSLNNPVGNSLSISNLYKGKYALKLKDQSSCDTIRTPYFVVPDSGTIVIDTTGKLISASKCTGITGSILQLRVTAGETFLWTNTATSAVVGNAVNLYNQPSGNYQLTVGNHFGCNAISSVFFIPQAAFMPIAVQSFTAKDGLCLQNNGSITINSFTSTPALYNFQWMDSISGRPMGNNHSITNLAAGVYQLFATDTNGCNNKIFSAPIKVLPVPAFDYSQTKVINDDCNLQQGSIGSISINGLTGPTTYTWYNQANTVTGNKLPLQNIGAGTYILKVTDVGTCQFQSDPFIIVNADHQLSLPLYDSLVIPRYSDANIILKNPATGTYRLMVNTSGSSILQQNSYGDFIVLKIITDTAFYVQRSNGTCSSGVQKILIKVVDKSFFLVPSAFTPNGDGVNDRLSVKIIGYINLNNFRLYNKWGEMVFETHDLNNGWNGVYKGQLQNTSSYIWIAEGKDINGNPISSKGITTLIR